jgi:hypothetical protein
MSEISTSQEPNIPKRLLIAGERAQHMVGHTRLGSSIIRAYFTGSESPSYRQLDWQSWGITAQIHGLAEAGGDPKAGRFAKDWPNATVIGASRQDFSNLERDAGDVSSRQAIAYIVDGAPHVGTLPPDSDELLFRELGTDTTKLAVATRLGRNAVTISLGLWLEASREFRGVEQPEIVVPSVAVAQLPQSDFSNLRLA